MPALFQDPVKIPAIATFVVIAHTVYITLPPLIEYPVDWLDISRMYTRLRYQLDLQAKVVVAKVKRL